MVKLEAELKQGNCPQEFLNHGQYQRKGILRYEKVFGKTFVSTGGVETTKKFLDPVGLKPGMKVLDIGSGTGGSAFFMAKNYGVEVLGIDLTPNMLAIANEHKSTMDQEVQTLVSFRYLDATKAEFPENHFDLVYSRDAIMHIFEKEPLYQKVLKWLKPGGQILVSEYVHGKNYPDIEKEYVDYVNDRGYQLLTVEAYGEMLRRVGFTQVSAIDKSAQFLSILKLEMERFKPTREQFVKEFSLQDYNELVDGWDIKVVRVSRGDQGWGLFKAVKRA